MERLLIRGLLSIAAQSSHIGFHHRYSSGGSVYYHASVGGHNRACDSSAVGQRDVQRLRRGDFLHRRPLNLYVASKLRFNQKSFVIRFCDGAAEAIAILEHHLIREEGGAAG